MIPFPQSAHRISDENSLARSLVAALPRAYAVVFYSTDLRFGWAMLVLSLCVPQVGLPGLAGVVFAAVVAWVLGFDRAGIRSGFLLFNPLLSCSAVALLGWTSGWPLAVTASLWAAAAVCSMMLTSAMQGWIGTRSGLSVQSLPSVIVVALLHYAGMGSAGAGWVVIEPSWTQVDLPELPGLLRGFFRAFAAMVFQSSDVVGMLVYLAFVLSSPLGGSMATVGFFAGVGTLHLLGLPVGAEETSWCGYNFLLAGIALGAGYHVPNRSSVLLAAAGAAVTAMIAIALASMLGGSTLGPGALPYNLVVLGAMASLRLVARPGGLLASPWTTLQPEGVARLVQINRLRFPDFHKPALFLPCAGETVVTQGFDGKITHRGAWRHALDFEAPGAAGSWDAGSGNLHEFAIFGAPVYAPLTGTVVAVENQVPDNPVGHNNPESNWGNHVILRSDMGLHVMLAHFLQGSITVAAGQRVTAGTFLGSCGNSGRSPVPHLHLHAQDGPRSGAPTLPFVLKHYVERAAAGGPPTYRLSGVPRESTVLRPAQPSAELHACFTGWLPGIYHFDNDGTEETVQLDFDEAGRFRLTSAHFHERLVLYLSEGVLYADPFIGRRSGVLSLLSIVLARVPCIEDPSVVWHDVVAAAPFLRGSRRLLHDVCDPFLNAAVLPYQYALSPDGAGFRITAELGKTNWRDNGTPKRLEAKIKGRSAVVAIDGETCGRRRIRVRLKGYHLAG